MVFCSDIRFEENYKLLRFIDVLNSTASANVKMFLLAAAIHVESDSIAYSSYFLQASGAVALTLGVIIWRTDPLPSAEEPHPWQRGLHKSSLWLEVPGCARWRADKSTDTCGELQLHPRGRGITWTLVLDTGADGVRTAGVRVCVAVCVWLSWSVLPMVTHTDWSFSSSDRSWRWWFIGSVKSVDGAKKLLIMRVLLDLNDKGPVLA